MKTIYLLAFVAILAGVVLPVQAGLNAKMGKALNDPVYATLISFVVGTLGFIVYGALTGMPFANITKVGELHWTVWTAGLLGGLYVLATIILVPRIGASLTFGLVVAGQLGLALLMDHYGWLGVPVHQINWPRVIGILLIIGGVILIRNF